MSDPRFDAFRPGVVGDAVRQPGFDTIAARARRRQRRRVAAIAATALAVVAVAAAVPILVEWPRSATDEPGGPDSGPNHSMTDFESRASAVVNAWQSSGLAYSSGLGFVPEADLTTLTAASPEKPGTFNLEDTFPDEATYQAFLAGRYGLSGSLPAATPEPGTITFAGGASLEMPLAPAPAAYAAMQRANASSNCDKADCVVLTVTGASLGSVPLPTSRGEASVPAWLFTVAGLRAPLARVAVASSTSSTDVLRLPSELLPQEPPEPWLTYVERVQPTGTPPPSEPGQARRITLHFVGGACDKSRTGRVYETPEAVVVGVEITMNDGACVSLGVPGTVDVDLAQPLGDRVVLTATTGRPITPG